MNSIVLPKRAFQPFETILGEVHWDLPDLPKNLELRLFWSTRGRGTEETHVVSVISLAAARAGSQAFSFTLPGTPWSVDGQLITVVWALELVAKKKPGLALEEIVVSPTGLAVVLEAVDPLFAKRRASFFDRMQVGRPR